MFRSLKLTGHSCTNQLTHLGVAAALLALSTFGASSAAFAQEGNASEPSKLERLFDVTSNDLVARPDADALPANPVAEDNTPSATAESSRSTARPDIHAETSVENFQGTQGNLSYTHESAEGFRKFLEQWYPTNFHSKDTNVSTWLFHDYDASNRNYDLWSSGGIDYGIDAVLTAFHSGHGGMSSNLFFAPMGANWDNTGWNAESDLMALGGNYNHFGDERLRYMFWDTCNSVMVSGGNDPYTTWGTRAHGIRFIFGYETTSIDSPNYGKYFWEEWSKGKTLKYAFLDASWRINTGQSPALVAFGATKSEAASRRDNERYLSSEAVSNTWGAWSWYSARSTARTSIAEALANLSGVGQVDIASRSNSDGEVVNIAKAFGLSVPDASAILSRPAHIKMVRTSAMMLAVEENGNFELSLNTPEEESYTTEEETDTETVMSDESLMERAQRIANQLSFLKGQRLRVGSIRDLNENMGTDGYQGDVRVTEKTVVLDQTIRGTPFIDPEAGHLEITFSAQNGQAKHVRNTLKAIQPVQARDGRAAAQVMTLEEARQAALAAFQQGAGNSMRRTSSAEIIAASEAIGYQMIDGKAVLVYRAYIKSAAMAHMRPFQAIIPLVK
jgi:hypothetical protein